jgi:hypothetical protein
MFIAALFAIAKLCKQFRCSTTMNGLRKCDIYIHTHRVEYYSAIKKIKLCHLQKMDRTGDHNVKQNKPDSDSQISHVLSHIWNLDFKSM